VFTAYLEARRINDRGSSATGRDGLFQQEHGALSSYNSALFGQGMVISENSLRWRRH